MSILFQDRREAGRRLAGALTKYHGREDVIVLALPRGGVPIAVEIATALTVQWDIWLVRKLGVPGSEELAMGAVATGGVRVLNEDILSHVPNAKHALEIVIERESAELARRETLYRQGRPPPSLKDKLIMLTDDGLATGATMRAAVKALRQFGVRHCSVAVPVGAKEACALLRTVADEVVCLETPARFYGVGDFYADFAQVTDEQVLDLLMLAKR